jgi:hypothetical protein
MASPRPAVNFSGRRDQVKNLFAFSFLTPTMTAKIAAMFADPVRNYWLEYAYPVAILAAERR